MLYSFGPAGTSDGTTPTGRLVMDTSGNLFGTTFNGGGASNDGTVFELSPSDQETVLHAFGSTSGDGIEPNGSLIMDASGNLYGVTKSGGANNTGTVFEITP